MTMITPSYLGETIEYSSLHACRSTLEDPTSAPFAVRRANRGEVPSEGTQRAWALATVVGAYVVALVVGR